MSDTAAVAATTTSDTPDTEQLTPEIAREIAKNTHVKHAGLSPSCINHELRANEIIKNILIFIRARAENGYYWLMYTHFYELPDTKNLVVEKLNAAGWNAIWHGAHITVIWD